MNIKEFTKLFKINIPIEEYLDYYIETLNESKEFSDLKNLIIRFEQYEKYVNGLDIKLDDYKMKIAFKTILPFFQENEKYKELEKFYINNHNSFNLTSKDELFKNNGRILISFDFKSSNYNVIRSFNNSLPETWQELLQKLNIHPVLSESKSFRQLVLGNLNPKMLNKISHYKMMEFIKRFNTNDIIYLSQDEVVVIYNGNTKLISEEFELPVRKTILSYENLPSGYLKNIWLERNINDKSSSLILDYKSLYCVSANKYFWYFKKYILNKELDDRDLTFICDGEKAKFLI